jgi:hypothetical protein
LSICPRATVKAVVDHLIGHAAGTGLLDFQRRGVIF